MELLHKAKYGQILERLTQVCAGCQCEREPSIGLESHGRAGQVSNPIPFRDP